MGDFELPRAIKDWRIGEAIPGTNGRLISDTEVLVRIETWSTQVPPETPTETTRTAANAIATKTTGPGFR